MTEWIGRTDGIIHFRRRAANQMRLYKHSARCQIALRAFLDCNPEYWCFIPMQGDDALFDNLRHSRGASNDEESHVNETNQSDDDEEEDPQLQNYIQRVPIPPATFAFSHRQQQKQRRFFCNFLALSFLPFSYRSLDLYQYKVITVCQYSYLFEPYYQ